VHITYKVYLYHDNILIGIYCNVAESIPGLPLWQFYVVQSGTRQFFLYVLRYFYISFVLPILCGHSYVCRTIFISVQYGREAHPVICITGTGRLSRSVALTTHLSLAPRLKKGCRRNSVSQSVFSWYVIGRPLLWPDRNKE
jgi:hypothetical protein